MKYAVIGGGFSGLLLTYLLEKKGIDVTLYEKEENVGGHCQSISNKGLLFEIGNALCFSKHIKELLVDLDIEYIERFTYRNFIDDNFLMVEQISRDSVDSLIKELKSLKKILKIYSSDLNGVNYGYIHKDLMISLYEFLSLHNLTTISEVLAPHLSSFGFGSIYDISAYYAFNVFTSDTIDSFIKGEKLLFIKKGMSEIIERLKTGITDIRYSSKVESIEPIENKVTVVSSYESNIYDKVIITAKLKDNVIKDDTYKNLMSKLETHPYVTCAFESYDKNILTTYYKANLGKKEKIQFFHTFKKSNRTIIVAYAYGYISQALVDGIKADIESSGVSLSHLITAKQWDIFPHLKKDNLDENFYINILNNKKDSNITFSGSLISKPALSNLYLSIKDWIE